MSERFLDLSHAVSGFTRRRLLETTGAAIFGVGVSVLSPEAAYGKPQGRIKPAERQSGLPETIPLQIPDLNVEKYSGQIRPVSEIVIQKLKDNLTYQLTTEKLLEDKWIALQYNGSSAVANLPYGTNGEDGWLLKNGADGEYYTDLDKGDELILPGTNPGLGYNNVVSEDGKILYHR